MIIYQHKDEEECKKEMQLVADKINSLITLHSSPITILGPSPCFYSKIRGKYRWQIVIKIKDKIAKSKDIINLLKTLPADWIIDVEPATLL